MPQLIIQIELPAHLCQLANIPHRTQIAVNEPATQRTLLDALEAQYPMLRGTIRDHQTQLRRPFLRFFACNEDLSHLPPDAELPPAVLEGREPFIILGAIAGG
jgi:molybdopterin synthase sulfur carrier subunit